MLYKSEREREREGGIFILNPRLQLIIIGLLYSIKNQNLQLLFLETKLTFKLEETPLNIFQPPVIFII